MAINLAGYLYSDNGTAITGADVTLIASDASTEATTTTSSGLWTFSEADEDVYDIKIQSGSQIRYIKGADKLSVKEIDVRNNAAAGTPSFTFTNYTNTASNQIGRFRSLNTTRADGDEIYLSFNLVNDNAEETEFARITAEANDVSNGSEDGEIRFSVMKAGTLTDVWTLDSSTAGATAMDMNVDSFTIGASGDTDITLTFDANTSDGVITWMEDEDYFAFSDEILMNTTEKIHLRDTAIYINSSTDGQLDLVADTEIQIAATTIDINGAVAFDGALTGITNITISGTLSDGNYTFDTSGNVSGLGTIGSGAITSSGNITSGGSFIIGSASIAEAELEMIDGITAGTAAASKAVVLDGSKNIATIGTIASAAITASGTSSFGTGTTIGNLTLANGSITDSGGTISFGNENISTTGTATLATVDIGAGAIDGTTIGAASAAAGTFAAVVGTTGTFSGVVDITDTTDSSDASGDTGALRTEGGASIAKKLYVGTDLDVDGTAELDNITIAGSQGSDGNVLTSTGSGVAWEAVPSASVALDDVGTGDGATTLATTVGNITIDAQANDADVIIKVDDNGSAVTAVTFDGSDEGNALFVNDIKLISDSAVLSLGDGNDFTITHDGTTGATLVGNPITITSGGAATWSSSAGALTLTSAAATTWSTAAGVLTIDGDDGIVLNTGGSGNVQVNENLVVGVDDTGYDVTFFGAAAGSYMLWDEDANLLDIRGATAAGPGHLKLTTGELTVVDADILGRIDFQAPLESDGSDAVLVGASIWAEADDTFSGTVNNTDIVFATGKTATAAERFRFTADNEIGIAGANYGTDGQVLTSGGAGAAVAWEDASGGGGTFEAEAYEDLAAGDPVALMSDTADSDKVKVEKIRGMTEHASDPKTSYDALSLFSYRRTIFHCNGSVDKWARTFIDNDSYYLWVQVGDFSTTTNSITWGEAVAVTDYNSYPDGGCWAGGSIDRIFVMGGRGSNDIKGWLYQINTSTNKVVTVTDSGAGLYAPGNSGAGVTITDGDYDTGGGVFCHFATSGEAANKIIVIGTRADGSNGYKQEIHALEPTGSSTNLVEDYIAGEYIQSVQSAGTYPAFAWNDNGNGAGLMTYSDGGDSSMFKLKAFIMNDTPGWTYDTAHGSAGEETLSADQTQRNAGGDAGVGSVTADTSNGNFVLWLRGASDGSAAVAVVNVDPSDAGITTHASTQTATTIFANMSAHVGIARDFSNKTAISTYRLPISNTAAIGIHTYNGAGIYDPDTDSHIFMYPLRMHKTQGHTEYTLGMSDSTWIAAIVTVTLSGTNDFDMAIDEPDWFKPVNRYGSMMLDNGTYDNWGYSMAYDTTHNQALFEAHHGNDYTTHVSSLPYDSQFLFQGTTTANKYRKSNMDKFIGFNTAQVNDGATATITVAGGLNENQSNLVKGERYYIGDGGVLRATAPIAAFSLYKAGIATDTTKLLVQADYMVPGNVS